MISQLAKLLFKEKTNAPKKEIITFTTSGVYLPPYGKTKFQLQGQGVSGNAGYTAYAGTNTAYYTFPYTIWRGGSAVSYDYANGLASPYYQPNNILGYGVAGTQYGPFTNATPYSPTPYNDPPGTVYATVGNVVYSGGAGGITISYTNNGFTYYPGSAYYSYVSGSSGATNTVLGVTLPGGAADSAAPVVLYTPVTVNYSSIGTPVTVPSGGYIYIKNI